MRRLTLLLALTALTHAAEPSTSGPSSLQKEFINRGYGMFIHFGVNTFNQIEWSYGKLPIQS